MVPSKGKRRISEEEVCDGDDHEDDMRREPENPENAEKEDKRKTEVHSAIDFIIDKQVEKYNTRPYDEADKSFGLTRPKCTTFIEENESPRWMLPAEEDQKPTSLQHTTLHAV